MNEPSIDSGHRFESSDRVAEVMHYHQQTKHHFHRYARSLGYMDWANQPNPFRKYEGSPLVSLPLLKPDEAPLSPLYVDLYRRGAAGSAVSVRSLSRFFEYALAITAWKQAGNVRWALRANPSSGNLHPTEGYVLIGPTAGVSLSPALYHYSAEAHALELRAAFAQEDFHSVIEPFPPGAFIVGFTSVQWREIWKYGERAFRYCQHDVGHAIGSARIAAQTLGWCMLLLDGISDDTIAALLGVDRDQDFEGAEREHPDCLLVAWPGDSSLHGTQTTIPLSLDSEAVRKLAKSVWRGKANRLSVGEPVSWEIIARVENASWKSSTEQKMLAFGDRAWNESTEPMDAMSYPADATAGQIIHQRRSALAFDGKTSLSARTLYTMLSRVMPHANCDQCKRPMPWDVLPWPPSIHLVLFIHRVDGLDPGVYMLLRDPDKAASLKHATYRQYAWTAPPGCPSELPLYLLQAGDVRQLAAEVSCHQEIAGDGAFSLGMIAEFESSLSAQGPWFYRRMFWETGLIGQVLYLEAEAHGVRATGIGCFFDDPVHQLLGFRDLAYQSLYHFTIGGHVEDRRLIQLPPYNFDR